MMIIILFLLFFSITKGEIISILIDPSSSTSSSNTYINLDAAFSFIQSNEAAINTYNITFSDPTLIYPATLSPFEINSGKKVILSNHETTKIQIEYSAADLVIKNDNSTLKMIGINFIALIIDKGNVIKLEPGTFGVFLV